MAKTLTHNAQVGHRDGGAGLWAALLVVALLILAVWGAWRLGVMAGDKVEWRRGVAEVPALRKSPDPQPIPIPTQRRPAVSDRR